MLKVEVEVEVEVKDEDEDEDEDVKPIGSPMPYVDAKHCIRLHRTGFGRRRLGFGAWYSGWVVDAGHRGDLVPA